MRKKRSHDGLTVNAIAGTHVVLLGLDLTDARRKGCLGFAIRREDHTEDERYWMSGMKAFQATDPGLGPGGQASSRDQPFQTFQWSDYSAKPEHDYTYTVLPLYGTPAKLTPGSAVDVRVATEPEYGQTHSVFFNRGSVATQEYARRFQNMPPSKVGAPAYAWLSRGLFEALTAFIRRAKGAHYALYGAIYEFQWPAVLDAVRDAVKSGATVRMIIDTIPAATGPASRNRAAAATAKVKQACIERSTGKIMHNKFLILAKGGRPEAVWTGSTNWTENGIFGHSNVGHIVEDRAVAAEYYAYWQQLRGDPATAEIKQWNEDNNAAPPSPWDAATTSVFSPHRGLDVLEWYAQIAGSAKGGLFMTFAFGMHALFQQVFEQPDGVLRFALMEKEGNGAGLAKGRTDIKRIRKLPNVVVAVATNIRLNSFDRWLKEMSQVGPGVRVRWVHDKFMLVDPLGPTPKVVTGSANFSKASTDTNDENMLVIQDDLRVADIYVGEFMRLYSHYAYREAVANSSTWNAGQTWQPQYLVPSAAWQKDYFTPGHQRFLRRRYFRG